MKKTLFAALFVAFLMTANFAVADPVAVGSPTITGSWTQGFQEAPPCDIVVACTGWTSMASFIETAGVNFGDASNPTGTNGFTDASWSSSKVNPQYNLASGNFNNNIVWNYTWSSAQSTPFDMHFYAFDGSTLVDAWDVAWSGSNFSLSPLTTSSYAGENTATPEPASLSLLGFGLVGLGTLRKKLYK